MTRQPLHIRVAAALVGLLGFALVITITTCQSIARTVQRRESQHSKENR